MIVYTKPQVNDPITAPCAITLNLIRNILVLIVPRFLYEYAPYPHAPIMPMIPVTQINDYS